MARKDKLGKTGESAWTTQGDRALRRLLEDDELRSTLLGAYIAARSAYGRLSDGKSPHVLFEDPELQGELIAAAGALREATSALTSMPAKNAKPAPARRRRRRGRRSLMLVIVGATLAVALSAELRSKLLDLLFGAEEEFDYASTTTPSTPAPAGVAGS